MKVVIISCDNGCKREIRSDTHAGSWLTIIDRDIFNEYTPAKNKYFCSYACLMEHSLHQVLRQILGQESRIDFLLTVFEKLTKLEQKALSQICHASNYEVSTQCFESLCDFCLTPDKCVCVHHLPAESIKKLLA